MVRAAALKALIGAVTVMAESASAAQAEPILVNESSAVATCERLGDIKGSSAWGGMVTNIAYNRALKQLRDRAEKMGATHVLLLNVSSGFSGSNMLGTAYRCAEAANAKPLANLPAPQ